MSTTTLPLNLIQERCISASVRHPRIMKRIAEMREHADCLDMKAAQEEANGNFASMRSLIQDASDVRFEADEMEERACRS